jgi:hypothetical protein
VRSSSHLRALRGMWFIGHRVDILDCGLDSFVSMLGTVSPPSRPLFPHLLVRSSSRGLDGKEKSLNPNTEHTRIPPCYPMSPPVFLHRCLAVYGPERVDIGRSYAYWVLEPGHSKLPRSSLG